MLTGWPQEDLLDALGGTPAAGGALFDRLEDVLPGPTKQITVSMLTGAIVYCKQTCSNLKGAHIHSLAKSLLGHWHHLIQLQKTVSHLVPAGPASNSQLLPCQTQ